MLNLMLSLRPALAMRQAAVPLLCAPRSRQHHHYYSTISEEIRQKAKLPVYRKGDEEVDSVAVGKLRESEHAVAIMRLEFIRIEDLLTLDPALLDNVVVVPKSDKVSSSARMEKLEGTVERLGKQVEDLLSKLNLNNPKPPRPL